MAVIVAKAMSKENQANVQTKAVIDKLAQEYADELEAIGVHKNIVVKKDSAPANTENKLDRFTFSGAGRCRLSPLDRE